MVYCNNYGEEKNKMIVKCMQTDSMMYDGVWCMARKRAKWLLTVGNENDAS